MTAAPAATREMCDSLNKTFNRELHRRTLSETERATTAAAAAVYMSLDTRHKIRCA